MEVIEILQEALNKCVGKDQDSKEKENADPAHTDQSLRTKKMPR